MWCLIDGTKLILMVRHKLWRVFNPLMGRNKYSLGMFFLIPRPLILWNIIEITQPIIMCRTFNLNSCTTIDFCYNPTDAPTFYAELSSLVQLIPYHSEVMENKKRMHLIPKTTGYFWLYYCACMRTFLKSICGVSNAKILVQNLN